MANITARTCSNVFYKARCEAAKHNEQLSSREGAADIMSIDRGRLYRIESSIINPYPEEIRLMADLYNAPELENHYCTNMCPLGRDMPKADLVDLDRISIKALSTFRKLEETKELLLDIMEDGVIDESEEPQLNKILGTLDELEQVAQSLKIWVRKNLRVVR
ncbi:MAG: XRE family transcriptional regulator [Ruminococcus flavefaciens]|nr:XRE family transcriptional regulator [Ruminococcus flavefaciens]